MVLAASMANATKTLGSVLVNQDISVPAVTANALEASTLLAMETVTVPRVHLELESVIATLGSSTRIALAFAPARTSGLATRELTEMDRVLALLDSMMPIALVSVIVTAKCAMTARLEMALVLVVQVCMAPAVNLFVIATGQLATMELKETEPVLATPTRMVSSVTRVVSVLGQDHLDALMAPLEMAPVFATQGTLARHARTNVLVVL